MVFFPEITLPPSVPAGGIGNELFEHRLDQHLHIARRAHCPDTGHGKMRLCRMIEVADDALVSLPSSDVGRGAGLAKSHSGFFNIMPRQIRSGRETSFDPGNDTRVQ
jgi:hypothetical protein